MLTFAKDLARTAALVAFPHGGQERSRRNALGAVLELESTAALRAEAAAAFDRPAIPGNARRAR